MGYLNFFPYLATFFLLSCGASLASRENASLDNLNELIGQTVEGRITLQDGETFDFREDLDKDILVLIFAQDTCSKCSREAREIANKIAEIGHLPGNMEIVTYLTGLVPQYAAEDAADWISDNSVSWKVGFKKDSDDLLRKYFPLNPTVPSIIIQKYGKITFAHIGEFGQQRIEEKTGDWL